MSAKSATRDRPGRPRAHGVRRRAFALAVGGWAACGAVAGANVEASEYEIKAAYLCKFGLYVEWPGAVAADPAAAFVIAVMAPDAVFAEMSAIAAGQSLGSRPVHLRRLRPGERADDAKIVFIARGYGDQAPAVLAALRGRAVLTVTEAAPDGVAGAMMNFVIVQDRVKFDVALTPVDQGGLKISSRLLGLAHVVVGRGP